MVNGQHFSGTGYQLDGTENRDPILGIIVINPNLESIGETKITSQNYDAEFGQAIAGVVSVQTKSGTNEFHGSAVRVPPDATSSRPATRSRSRTSRTRSPGRVLPETKRDQFGGSIGGPIQQEQVVLLRRLPGHARYTDGGSQAADRAHGRCARTGDLSEYGVNIFDPAERATPGARTQFPGNVIPANRLSPAGPARSWPCIPLPNTPGTGTAPATTTSPRARRSSTATPSTSAWTGGSATA